ncbi:hypothetical protein [Clostridium hydrogenum]|uniref:hypothetical protein n=1 Tax=Clostridium hydrogenum TaxID=2855764 RepID=UPI001F3A0C33|nr:hypothetical protein [Clostridium hydrogenum]
MKVNKKIIIGFAVILLVIWIGNIIYYKRHILKAPLFVKNYCELGKDGGNFELDYIEDIKSNDKIEKIDFPEIKKYNAAFSELCGNTYERFYALKTIEITFTNDEVNEYKNKIITKAIVKFSSGKTMKVNLGKIYFGDDVQVPNGLKLWNSSGDCYSFTVNKDTSITGIKSRFKSYVKDALKISINGKKISDKNFPIELKNGDDFYMTYEINFSKNDIRRYNSYNIDFDVITEDKNGHKGSIPCFVNSNFSFTDDIDINSMKRNSEVK